MRIHYMSDLHLEFSRPVNLPTGEVLLLAGDVTVARCLDPRKTDAISRSVRRAALRFFDQARSNFDHVIYLAGNHEHYRGDIGKTADIIKTHLAGDNLAFLENEAKSIGDVTFLCATLWTDMDRRDPIVMRQVGLGMNDFALIASGDGKFWPEDAVGLHERSLDWLRSELELRQNEKIVVATHHAPSRLGLHPDHSGDELDGGYASDLEGFIREHRHVNTWVFGHTHVRTVFKIGSTILRANCAGYDEERRGFDSNQYFDV